MRKNKLLSQYHIKKFGQSTISDWETGRYSPTLSNLKIYLKFLDVDNSLFLSNKIFVKEVEYKFKLPNLSQKRKPKIYCTKDLHIILTKEGRKRIKLYRKRIGSQNAVARLSRINQSTISYWEFKKINPTLTRLKNYLEIIGLHPSEFLNNKAYIKEIREPIVKKWMSKSIEVRTKKILPQNILTKEKAYILGIIGPGDGWLGQNQIDLTVTDKDFAKNFQEKIEQVYGIKSKIKIIPTKIKKHKTLFKVRISSKLICDDIKEYKVPFKEKIWRIPNEVKESNNKIKIGYIKGIFDSQAHVSIPKKEIRTVILNIPGLYELKSLFNDLGINTHLSEKVSKLTICGRKNIENYNKNIGFYINRKQEALNILLNSYSQKRFQQI